MFEHLDDQMPFTPPPEFRAEVLRRGRSRRRRRFAVRAGLVGVASAALLAVTAVAVVDRRLDDVERVEVAGLEEVAGPTSPYTVLLVGTDGAAGLDDAGLAAGPGRSDAVVLVRVEPARDRVRVLPLPRDLRVDVPGHGPARINDTLALGGHDALVAAVETGLGVEVNRYVSVDLPGARRIGDAVGGLRLRFAAATRDRMTGFAADPGCQVLDGGQLLALGRARRIETLGPNGTWMADATSDVGRIERQQAIAAAVLGALSHLDTTSPRAVDRFVDAVVGSVTLDDGTDRTEMIAIFRDLAGSDIRQLRLPVEEVTVDGAVLLDPAPGADDVLEAFDRGTEPPTEAAGPSGPAGAVVPTPC